VPRDLDVAEVTSEKNIFAKDYFREQPKILLFKIVVSSVFHHGVESFLGVPLVYLGMMGEPQKGLRRQSSVFGEEVGDRPGHTREHPFEAGNLEQNRKSEFPQGPKKDFVGGQVTKFVA
jgi:hypothetical protein